MVGAGEAVDGGRLVRGRLVGVATAPAAEDNVGDLYSYVASLYTAAEGPPVAASEEVGAKDFRRQRAAAGFGAATVKRSYLGGVSTYWRPFLQELAAHPDEWRSWEQLCEAIDPAPKQASGMLGAAERRCRLLPPYEKAFEDSTYWFRMPKDVATVVLELASKEEV